MKNKLFLITGIVLFFYTSITGQTRLVEKVTKKGNELVIPYEKYILSNGLTLIIHEDHSDPIVHINVTYDVGSSREEVGKSGFAHFFEHMMFQGSDHVDDEEHFKIVTDAGGQLNGTTNQDYTNYYETVPVNQLEKMLWLEADRMGFLLDAVTQQKFEVQRATVKNERGQNFDNIPYGLAQEVMAKNLYPYGHPYSWPAIGYIDDLNHANLDDLKNFFLRWYGPNNATLIVGGDVKTGEVIKLVEKYFGPIPGGPAVRPITVAPIVLDRDRYVSYTDNFAQLPRLSMTFPTVAANHKDMAALDFLARVFGQGKNSLCYQLLQKPQLALQAFASGNHLKLAGEFTFTVVPAPGRSLADMEKLVRAVCDSFELRGITDKDLASFKNDIETWQINNLESLWGKLYSLAHSQALTGNTNYISDQTTIYAAVTAADVMRVYKQYIKGKHCLVLSIVPKNQEKLIAAANNYSVDSSNYLAPDNSYAELKYVKPVDKFDRSKKPANGPDPVVKIPSLWTKRLSNGVKIMGVENDEAPTVTLTLSIPGGHLLQAKDLSKVGLANFFVGMLSGDTKNYTDEAFDTELEKIGSSIYVYSKMDEITFSVRTLKKHLDKTVALLEERLLHPRFTNTAFERIRQQILENINTSNAGPSAIASTIFAKINYGSGNILTTNSTGTAETIKNITLADIQYYYDHYITSQGAKVVVVGDMKQEELLSTLSFLHKLPNKKITIPAINATPRKVDRTKIYLVNIPKAAQTQLCVGYGTGLKYDATGEYYKTVLMNFPLGGDFNSRINQNLREGKGLTYAARSIFEADKYTGKFECRASIRAGAIDSALVEVVKELKNYAANGITEEELLFTKNAIGQREALRYEGANQKANFIARMLDYDLSADHTTTQHAILKNISRQEINVLAKKWIRPDKMNILLVGDKASMMEGISNLGYEIIELDIHGNRIGQQHNLELKASIKGIPDGTIVFLHDVYNNKQDSTIARNNRFSFTKSLQEGTLYNLTIGRPANNDHRTSLYLHPNSKISITGNGPSLKNIQVAGSPYISEWMEYRKKTKNDLQYLEHRQLLLELYGITSILEMNMDTVALFKEYPREKFEQNRKKLIALSEKLTDNWLATYPRSLINGIVVSQLLYDLLTHKIVDNTAQLEKYLPKIHPEARNNIFVQKMLHSMAVHKAVAIGKPAPLFTQNDMYGQPVSLASFKGSYVLIEFWASWCGPCRAENPFLKNAWNKYKDKNFTILSVSLDKDKDKWLEAVKKDGLTWTQLSDLKAFDNAVAKLYDVHAIPEKLLIDPQGNLIARGLRGDNLDKKLQEIFR